jgi:enoyl-CoA hydratase
MLVRSEKSGDATTIILNRISARNAVDRDTADALVEAFLAFEADDNASVGVLYGEGGAFCAGADLKAVATGKGNRIVDPAGGAMDGFGPMGPSRLILSKPVIAAIEGPAVAGGLELALWCDMRVASADAVLGVYCRRWGVPLIDGGTVRLPRLIGHARAMDLILTGRGVGADEALAMGLVNRVVQAGEARRAAEALAADIARFPQVCMRQDRMSAIEQWDLPHHGAMANEFARGRVSLAAGSSEGAARFASGRGRGGRFDEI